MWTKKHAYRVSNRTWESETPPKSDADVAEHRQAIEPWLSALFQTEHLALLVGNGLTMGVAELVEAAALDMSPLVLDGTYSSNVTDRSRVLGARAGRSEPNIEDQIRAVTDLIGGLEITGDEAVEHWNKFLSSTLADFAAAVLTTERKIAEGFETSATRAAEAILVSFILSFASRTASRDRLHIFTTNYDRLIEHACDRAGIWKLDRFIGALTPSFRSSRLEIDIHYNPPGIRGEPRYFEGVLRLTKLHGSIDWIAKGHQILRQPMPFGCSEHLLNGLDTTADALIIYPNAAKDVETSEHPYAELFRDFSASIVRPDSTVVTYGYGFGDDHINRVLADMLTIPSTHLLVISYSDPDQRAKNFLTSIGRQSQVSFLVGSHFADLEDLVQWYLPKPAIDRVTWREADLLKRRGIIRTGTGEGVQDDGATDPGS